jgi:REP element-mobilizing transposase RayT
MHHRLLVHIVWTTRDRQPTIDRPRAAYLWKHLPIIARQERARVLELGIVATHLHLLVRLHPSTVIPRLLQRMKGGTATLINRQPGSACPTLRWTKGYSVTSVSPRQQDVAAAYVRHQHTHHPDEAIPGWPARPVASATSAEPRLLAAESVAMPPWPSSRSMR